jgi:5,10-methylene-tetrahydrofolate dehydrogenase/methenyl tetrahydrofolate cyclohydrolase
MVQTKSISSTIKEGDIIIYATGKSRILLEPCHLIGQTVQAVLNKYYPVVISFSSEAQPCKK